MVITQYYSSRQASQETTILISQYPWAPLTCVMIRDTTGGISLRVRLMLPQDIMIGWVRQLAARKLMFSICEESDILRIIQTGRLCTISFYILLQVTPCWSVRLWALHVLFISISYLEADGFLNDSYVARFMEFSDFHRIDLLLIFSDGACIFNRRRMF